MNPYENAPGSLAASGVYSAKLCFLCSQPIGNTMVGCEEGLAHELCWYKREYERPRDDVIAELRRHVHDLARKLGDTKPCVICRWPRPMDNEHNICECCGFQEGYHDPENYTWDGKWWSARIEAPPLIVERLLAELAPYRDTE